MVMVEIEMGQAGRIGRTRRMGVMRRRVLLRGVRAKRALAFVLHLSSVPFILSLPSAYLMASSKKLPPVAF